MKLYKLIALALLLGSFSACTKHKYEEKPDLGYGYYPGTKGSYVIYDVDSVGYSRINNDTTTLKCQIKEKVDSVYTDNQGRPTLKIIRYKKIYDPNIPYSAMSWTLQDVWSANVTDRTVEIVEENVRFTKLIFPVKKSATWNGNAHNILGQQDYKYTAIDQSSTVGGISFDKTLIVTQKYFPSAIGYEEYVEEYAKGVGMIKRTNIIYDYQDGNGNANPGHIYEGIKYIMTINSYGTE